MDAVTNVTEVATKKSFNENRTRGISKTLVGISDQFSAIRIFSQS